MTSKAMKNKKILLVDDEEGIRKVLKITLESAGYDVCLAPDGEAGLATFIREHPDIVITDIKMPGIDGIELLKRIKNLNPEIEVIMITGHGDMDLAVKSLQYEAADFITKPIDSGDLESAINKARDRIAISQNIKSYMDDLEILVEEKDKKLNESEKLVTIGQTIAGMSHAIKNIAGGLKGSSFVLEQGIEHENRQYLKQGWEMMKGNIDKITKLSLDLLNYAKTTKLNFQLENPNTPAREVMQLMTHRAKEKNIEFTLVPCTQKKLTFMDKDAMHNSILNLVTNAFDAFDDTIDPGLTRKVTLLVQTINSQIVYSVRDNGCGINDTIKKSVFNDFITTKGMNGTGFGLMTTKKIIEEHNGEIRFKTEIKKGSEFIIKIPLRTRV
ncbi:MAG: response regulator [Proteobacteria bacterium]|nr:response regulator [Pseudomonadota bacterium]MBU1581213.1 response regulator [Pseudomonadota bacterium]MBU2631261.1 response regulator [Pseudomonadota bacterium]